jgi:two-component system sensor histidine kinase/response regulator
MRSFDEAEYLSAVQSGDFSKLLEPQRRLLAMLRANPALQAGDPSEALAVLTESAARMLEVERVGLWRFDESRQRIVCLDLYVQSENRHERGAVVAQDTAPGYFAAIETGQVVAAEDAYVDRRTSELGSGYLAKNEVGAMLDTPVLIGGRLAGVLCHEHVGAARRWLAWERTLAASLSDCAGLILADVDEGWTPSN